MSTIRTAARGPSSASEAAGIHGNGRSIAVPRARSFLMTPDAPPAVLTVEDGLFALEALLPMERRRVLDFCLKGDLVHTRPLRGFTAMRLRAIEGGRIYRTPLADWLTQRRPEDLQNEADRQAARLHLLSAIVGLNEVDARLASLLMALSLRLRKVDTGNGGLDLKFPREDIASHILVNPDTLSRAYSRLRKLDIITRLQRHRLVIRSWPKLSALTPLASIIESVLA